MIAFIMFARIYLVLRLLTRFTKWRNKKAQRVCNFEGIEADSVFAMKALMKEQPYFILFLNFIMSSVIFGFAVRTVERAYYEDDETGRIDVDDGNYQDYTFLANGWWSIVVTMTTVGFGDFFAKTYLGRGVSIIACFYGVFLVSSTMVTLDQSKDMSQQEQRSY